jgi:CheY-like chemotaxis protein
MGHMINFLHVDNDIAWREAFSEDAGNLGISLRQFTTRKEALAAIAEVRPDIVITDLHLGENTDQSGYTIARAAIEAGVPYVSIASSTGTPSQKIEGVVIQTKNKASEWLARIVRRGPEQG